MEKNARPLNEVVVNLLPSPKASDGPHGGPNQRDGSGNFYLPALAVQPDGQWVATNGKDYGPAVRRWEAVIGHPAPCPTEDGTRGNRRLSAPFPEWMMGLEPGWVTDMVTDRSDALHVIGNGVVPLQAEEAFRFLMDDDNWNIERDDMSDATEWQADHAEALEDAVPEKPETYPCSGCAFSYTLVKANRKDADPTVIRKHNSRTGPGLCPGAKQPPRVIPEEMFTPPAQGEHDPKSGHMKEECGDQDPAQSEDDAAAEEADALYPVGPTVKITPLDQDGKPKGPAVPLTGVVSVDFGTDAATVVSTVVELAPPASLPVPPLDPWTAPAPASVIPDGSVSMQPEPDRDQWGRYKIMGVSHTRVTTFVKAVSSTFALEQWAARMVIKGLVLRPDLLALAHGLDVKRDKGQLDSIAAQAKEAAGQKVAANLGTAYHAFTERLDAGLITLDDVPEQYRGRVAEYADVVRRAGLTTRVEWIERTTAVSADQVSAALPVAGTLDRIFQLPNGELVIGDLKTGADLTYGAKEIESQLAVYAHGVNTFGLFDWNTKTWDTTLGLGTPDIKVRTDMGLVVHLPADGGGCTLYMIDLERGWRRAQLCGQAMADQKAKAVLMPLTLPEAPAVEPQERPEVTRAVILFQDAESRDALLDLARLAHESQAFTPEEMARLEAVAQVRWEELPA